MGTHPIFESDFDCLTAMEVVDIAQNSIHIQRQYNFTDCANLAETAQQILTKLDVSVSFKRSSAKCEAKELVIIGACQI